MSVKPPRERWRKQEVGVEDCIFCRIATKRQATDIIYETDDIIAFPDHNPSAPFHILIVPKKHIPTFLDIAPGDGLLVMKIVQAIQTLVRERNLQDRNYRVGINGGSFQHVMHLHWHLISRG